MLDVRPKNLLPLPLAAGGAGFCLLGFGGLSILLQVLSITSKTDLSIKPYIYGKLLHGILAAFYTFIFIKIFPFFNFDL